MNHDYIGSFWQCQMSQKVQDQGIPQRNVKYVYNKTEFDAVDVTSVEYLMGKKCIFINVRNGFPRLTLSIDAHYFLSWTFACLFQPSHMQYEAIQHLDPMGEPSLAEMVGKSIDIFSKNTEHGYFLYIENNDIHRNINTCMHTISSSHFMPIQFSGMLASIDIRCASFCTTMSLFL